MATETKKAYSIRCADTGIDCPFELQAETEDEVIRYGLLHVESVHGVKYTPDQVRPMLKEKSWSR